MGDIRKIGYFSWIIAELSRTSQPLILECSHTLQHTSSSLNMLEELICYELGWTEMWEHLQLSWLCCDCDILIPFGLERKTSFKRPVWEINESVTTGRQTSQLRELWTRWPGQRSRRAYKLYKHFLTATLQPVKLYLEHLAMCYVVFRESVQWWSWHILLYFGPRGHYLFECIQHCLTEMPK